MENIKLNLGCDNFKLGGFINIDINPKVHPDICMNLLDLDKKFEANSVDFIFAGHVLEHLPYEQSLDVLKKCYRILKSNRIILIIVPDYTKCSDLDIGTAERVILGQGSHEILFDSKRLGSMLSASNFVYNQQLQDLKKIPYMLVSNIRDPKPDPWQTSFMGLKI